MNVEILGGSHDGSVYAVPDGQHYLRLARLLPVVFDVDPDDPMPVPMAIEVYGPATEADLYLHRWSLQRVEEG